MTTISRRDFLKFAFFASSSAALAALHPRRLSLEEKKPNFIVLVADTLSASNMSLYGYERRTTPNLERLAARAIVYHAHYAGGNFTSPGTATILTGAYPWTHRAVNLGGLVRRSLVAQNIFQLLGSDYYRLGFSQNMWAELLLRQFIAEIDEHIPSPTFIHGWQKPLLSHAFRKDPLSAYYALDDFLISTHHVVNPFSGSASLGYLGLLYQLEHLDVGTATAEHPYGLPSNLYYYFENRVVYDGVQEILLRLRRAGYPFFAYIHLMSPHSPYRPTRPFVNSLAEVEFPIKQRHPLGERVNRRTLLDNRRWYDEFVANVDAEVGRLFEALDREGALEDTYFIFTSDHGELFERGVLGHATPLLYEPLIRVPLLVFVPGQSRRRDVHAPTSNADLTPSLLALAGRQIPPAMEGQLLPGLGGTEDPGRSVFSIEAKEVSSFLPLSRVTVSMVKGRRKLIYYKGYKKYPNTFELYDLENDREEKRDIYLDDPATAAAMKEELLDRLAQAERGLS